MASDQAFVDFVVDQLETDLGVTQLKMFGEYGLYSHGVIFALICDNQLFIKPTQGGRVFIGDVVEAPAYPGARPSLLIGDRIEDGAWLSQLVRISVEELPPPKRRKAKRK